MKIREPATAGLGDCRVVITGGNSGIGWAAARVLAGRGADVTITARDAARGAAALAALRAEFPQARIEQQGLDLADLGSVERFARIVDAGGKLDLLINNAGVMALPARRETQDEFEMQFGTNHLGHFALTGLVLPAMRKATAARVVSVSSLAHRRGRIDLDDLQSRHGYRPWRAYTQSKLANLMFALELQRRLARNGDTIMSVAAHPGVAATNLAAAGPMSGRRGIVPVLTGLIFSVVGQSAHRGALPVLFAATAADVAGGDYIGPNGLREMRGDPAPAWVAPQARDTAVAAELWRRSEQLTGVAYLST